MINYYHMAEENLAVVSFLHTTLPSKVNRVEFSALFMRGIIFYYINNE